MTAAALLGAISAWLAVTCPPASRLRAIRTRAPTTAWSARLRGSGLWTSPLFAAVLAAFAVTRFVPGLPGLLVALATGLVVHRWIGGLESAGDRRRREQIARDLPLAVDLMVSAISAGRPHGQVLALVGGAIGGPLADEFGAIVARLDLGSDPLTVWRTVAREPGLEPLGRSFARATDTGAPIGDVLSRCVGDLRAERRASAQQAARAVGVKTAAPLGACFLPAFILVGIVPTLIGAFQHLVI